MVSRILNTEKRLVLKLVKDAGENGLDAFTLKKKGGKVTVAIKLQHYKLLRMDVHLRWHVTPEGIEAMLSNRFNHPGFFLPKFTHVTASAPSQKPRKGGLNPDVTLGGKPKTWTTGDLA